MSISTEVNMKLRLLWITPKWPLPADDGSRLATVSLLRSITGQGLDVDLLALTDEAVADSDSATRELGVRRTFTLAITKRASSGLARLWGFISGWLRSPCTPLTMLRFNSAVARDEVLRTIGNGYSHVVFEGLHPAALFIKFGNFSPPIINCKWIYRAQNCESKLWEGAVSKSGSWVIHQIMRYQKHRVERFERSLLLNADAVATITETDAEMFRSLEPAVANRIHVVPLAMPERPLQPFSSADGIRLLFVGRLDWAPNRDGLEWFLREVWSKVLTLRSDLHLTVAGTGDGGWLMGRLPLERTSFIGRVPETTELYRSHHLALSPVFYGSGIRVKAVEAASLGRPVLGTRLGLVGIETLRGKGCLQGETASEWIEILSSIDKSILERMGQQAYAETRLRFSAGRVAEMFRPILTQSV